MKMSNLWDNEPNYAFLYHNGFRCHVRRHSQLLSLCGYVSVLPGHPWYGKHYDDIVADVHGGLTYSAKGEFGWVVGFDCAHFSDYVPGLTGWNGGTYRDIDYVIAECKRLADQASDVVVCHEFEWWFLQSMPWQNWAENA
jgi:hypothetical protein